MPWVIFRSDEAEGAALFGPVERQPGVGHQLVGREGGRLGTIEDDLGDVGGEERQAKQPGEVGSRDPLCLGELAEARTVAAQELLLQAMGSNQQLDQGSISLAFPARAVGTIDDHLLLHARALESGVDRQGEYLVIIGAILSQVRGAAVRL